ncbi:hypothetical protein NCCP2222_08380 [Sporosarcina sp. NCCP-2222]|uniref:DUF6612 family protein n=1 Tax=Sporosarcina sp. NCCP-2222 TaxID=2935073 RepID=UPI002089472E|nr:DUF6612 family protein [Sporosarcina sp. NCCP-2222]GKV54891.1 hypothetical protein NCCP2222_08380 [Sporosarcina sp. NCCP-2222]
MKKWLKVIGAGVLAFSLAACGNQAEPKTTVDAETGKEKETTDISKMTAQEVYEKAMAVSQEQKSMHTDMDIEQVMKSGGETVNSKITLNMDAVVEPMTIHQTMKMDMGEYGQNEMEMYISEKEVYMNDPETGQWIKFPEEFAAEMFEEMAGEDPTLDMKLFKDYVDEFKFEQTDDSYILKLKASGEKFEKLLKQMEEDQASGAEAEAEEMTLHDVYFEIFIDKETFYTTAFNMDMSLDMVIDGETVNTDQKVKAVITKINEVEVTVPQDVIDNAVDMSELMGE